MRKRKLQQKSQNLSNSSQDWLDLEQLAEVEFTSEDEKFPIESALKPSSGLGWRAAQPGKQTIRLLFDEPQNIKRINLLFDENEKSRTQEFLLSWYADESRIPQEIVRQQYNFTPPDTTWEFEDYNVDLSDVRAIELSVVPDIKGGNAKASLTQLRLA
jgi:hypothetical protein